MSLAFSDPRDVTGSGTLLWVGDRDCQAFRDAYDFCDARVSQLAYRRDLDAALARPATDVRTILLCRQNDSAAATAMWRQLCREHPEAKTVLLLGPLCAGARPGPAESFDVPAIAWHQWESRLPAYLRRCGWADPEARRARSIAVIASLYANAAALMTIAGAGETTAVWCRPEAIGSLQRFDEYWWDDSATQDRSWHSLFTPLARQHPTAPPKHVWVASDVTPEARSDALQHGVELVIAKPGQFTRLIERVIGNQWVSDQRAA